MSLVGHSTAGCSPAGESPLLRFWFSQPTRTASEYVECNHPRSSKRERVISNYNRLLEPHYYFYHLCPVCYLHPPICRQATLPTPVNILRWLRPSRRIPTPCSYSLRYTVYLENSATKSTNTMQMAGDRTSTTRKRISCAIKMQLRVQKTSV